MADKAFEAMSKARRQRDSGNIKGAVATLESYLETDPHNTKPRLLLAEILVFGSDSRSYGMMQLDIILDLEPDNHDARKALVTVLKDKKKNNRECDEHYRYLVEHCPNDAELMNSYAIFNKLQLVDFDRAEEYYLKAIALDPGNSGYRLNYAYLLSGDMDRSVDAKEQLEAALSYDPSNADVNRALVQLMERRFNADGTPKKKRRFLRRR
jgi:Tfp pilus assembly protein PilF